MGWLEDVQSSASDFLNTTSTLATEAGNTVVGIQKVIGQTAGAVGITAGTPTYTPIVPTGDMTASSPTGAQDAPVQPSIISASGTWLTRLAQKIGLPIWSVFVCVGLAVVIVGLIAYKLIRKTL